MLIFGFIISFLRGWLLTVVLLIIVPVMVIISFVVIKTMSAQYKNSMEAYADAGGRCEQALGAIRTVIGLNGQSKELRDYTTMIQKAKDIVLKHHWITATC
jgi:ATP-binding cassette, subfamily B (MDR/TAP), member 1